MAAELFVAGADGGGLLMPAAEEGIVWTTERRSVPGRLTFSAPAGGAAAFAEGSAVQLRDGGEPVFFGFVFSQRRGRDGRAEVTAYDQLRYLQNKDTYVYENKTASQLVRMLAADFSLSTGEIEDTGYVIASRVEDNTSLFDMIGNALDLTLQNTGEMFVLYDDFGKLALRNVSGMRVGGGGRYLLIDAEAGENFEYSSSIDGGTYDRIKLACDSAATGKREVYIAQDSGSIARWGVLQHYGTLSEGENGQAKADALLSLYNAKTRSLRVTGAFGDSRVRAGSLVAVSLDLGDVKASSFMLVEKASHTYKLDEHYMDLTLRGGGFSA